MSLLQQMIEHLFHLKLSGGFGSLFPWPSPPLELSVMCQAGSVFFIALDVIIGLVIEGVRRSDGNCTTSVVGNSNLLMWLQNFLGTLKWKQVREALQCHVQSGMFHHNRGAR